MLHLKRLKNSTPDETGRVASPSINNEQYEKLMSLLQVSSSKQDSVPAQASANQVFSTPSGHTRNGKHNTSSIFSLTCHSFALNSWIIDSGASDHICGNIQWFHSYNEITPMDIKLPIGQYAIAKHAGTIKFSSDFSITRVLYVPEFKFNLLFVSKISDSVNCIVIFNGSKCLIQEKNTQKLIGSGEKKE